jgi:hypothetical protein
MRTLEIDAVNMLSVCRQVVQHVVNLLLLLEHGYDAAQRCASCMVQPAVGPGGPEQAALVGSCNMLQHCLQAGVWQLQQGQD